MPNSIRLLRVLIVVAALIPPTVASAQRDDSEWLADCRNNGGGRRNSDWNRRAVHCEVREIRLRAPGGTISAEGLRNGGVSVTGWDRDSLVVKTRLRVQAPSESEARAIASRVRTVVNGSTITAEGPRNDEDDQWSASLVVWVPRRSDLRVETRNGPVSVYQVRGDLNVETRNGPLSLRDLGGSVRARTTNGPLSISLGGDRWDGSGLDAKTTNGPLTISVPTNYNAHLEAGTTNGPVSLGFPMTVVGRINRNISTDLGSGGVTIRAETTNGPLAISRR